MRLMNMLLLLQLALLLLAVQANRARRNCRLTLSMEKALDSQPLFYDARYSGWIQGVDDISQNCKRIAIIFDPNDPGDTPTCRAMLYSTKHKHGSSLFYSDNLINTLWKYSPPRSKWGFGADVGMKYSLNEPVLSGTLHLNRSCPGLVSGHIFHLKGSDEKMQHFFAAAKPGVQFIYLNRHFENDAKALQLMKKGAKSFEVVKLRLKAYTKETFQNGEMLEPGVLFILDEVNKLLTRSNVHVQLEPAEQVLQDYSGKVHPGSMKLTQELMKENVDRNEADLHVLFLTDDELTSKCEEDPFNFLSKSNSVFEKSPKCIVVVLPKSAAKTQDETMMKWHMTFTAVQRVARMVGQILGAGPDIYHAAVEGTPVLVAGEETYLGLASFSYVDAEDRGSVMASRQNRGFIKGMEQLTEDVFSSNSPFSNNSAVMNQMRFWVKDVIMEERKTKYPSASKLEILALMREESHQEERHAKSADFEDYIVAPASLKWLFETVNGSQTPVQSLFLVFLPTALLMSMLY